MIDLKAMSTWRTLEPEAEAQAAAAVLGSRPTTELRVLTWNVWFDDLHGQKRQQALFKEALAAAPDAICLQEVLPAFAASVRESQALRALYAISPQGVAPYGCMLLVRHDLRPEFFETDLPSGMARRLISARCGGRLPGLVLTTAHFESLHFEDVRRKQLVIAGSLLRRHQHAILCGDFNFDDTKTWGDWRRDTPAKSPEQLENNVLFEVLPEFYDTWREVWPDDPGYTFDGERNPTNIRDEQERMRYDRLMASRGGFVPTNASLLGTEVMEGFEDWGLRPSDHYGLLIDLEVQPAPEKEL